MVFESVVTDVLNKVIGDYVENLDRNQLKIGIWGGDVVLRNLNLRENALDDLDLPVQLVYGYLGKLVLNIPWKNLYKQPVVVQIEDFYALVSPKQAIPYDAEKEEKYQLQAKQTALAALDEARQKELDKLKPKPDATFTEKLTAQIVNNLQVKIANVHIRYEDMTTTGRPFAFGVTLHELDFHTTDENWLKKYLTEQVDRVFKICNLDSLSAYMNCAGELFSKYDKADMARLFRDSIARKDMLPPRFTYVLGPISSVAKLQLNMTPEYNTPPFAMPKVDLCLEMERLNVGLTSTQFQDVIKLMETMNRMQLGLPYRKYRPFNISYKGHYKEWWKFAITAVLEEDVRKRSRQWTWDHIKSHRMLCNTYAERYKEKELAKKPSASLVATCDLIETKLDLFNLLLIRQRAQIELDKLREEELRAADENKGGWFSGWWGGAKSTQEEQSSNIAKKFEAAMTEEEKSKLYKAIGYEENATPANVPIEYVALNLNFRLEALTLGLFDDEKEQLEAIASESSIDLNKLKTIALLEFSLAAASIKQRPAASAISITAGVRQMKLVGVRSDDFVPTIIESVSMGGYQTNLMDVFFETNPLDGKCDKRLHMKANSLRIVYDAETILSLIKVFAPPKSLNLSELEGAASAKMANVKQRSATGMKYIIDKQDLLEIDIKLQPNVLILPRDGEFGRGERALIILSLGAVNINSKPDRQRDQNIKSLIDDGEDIMGNILQQAYDRISLSIDNIQLLVAKPDEDWQGVLLHASTHEMHVLSPTSIIVELSMCVIKDDPRLPLTKMNILLPAISLHVTEDRIFEALKVIFSIPFPEGQNIPESGALIRAVSSASRLSVASLFNTDTKRKERRNSKKLITTELKEELIQFTEFEVTFALNVISISLVKSYFKDECEEESLSESTFGTPTNDEIEEIKDNASQLEQQSIYDIADDPLRQEKLLSIEIKQLEAKFAQRTYDMLAEAKLGAINVRQYDVVDSSKSVDLIDTPRFDEQEQYLLTINVILAEKTSPEFTTKYNSTEQMIVVKFATLNIILHQEYLLRLLTRIDTLQRRFEAICTLCKPNKPRDRVATAAETGILKNLTTIIEEHTSVLDEEVATLTSSALASTKRRGRKAKVVHSIKQHIQAEMEQVSLLLSCDVRPLALLKVEEFKADIILKTSYTELKLGLKNITVTDLNPKSIHTNILSIVGNDVLNCQVVLYNLEETSNYNKDNMKINVEIGCMKIVFLNWFVTAVLNFLNHFQTAVNALAEASAAAAETAKQSAVEAYTKATRMKLNIKMKAPIIVVPVHSNSCDAIALDLGLLVLSNNITELEGKQRDEDGNGPVLDEIKLELKNLKLSKVAILNEDERDSIQTAAVSSFSSVDTTDIAYGLKSNVNILDPISFALTVKRNLSSNWYTDLPELDISGRLKSIELNLFITDYALIISILHHNLSEGQNEFEPPELPKPKSSPPNAEFKKAAQNIIAGRGETPKPTMKSPNLAQPLKKVREQLKFSFLFDGIVANLMRGPDDGMARFGIHVLSVKGSQLIDGTLSTSVVLCNIQIDDARKNVKSKITKYLCRKDWKNSGFCDSSTTTETILERCQTQRNFMLDLTAIIKENDTFAEVRVCGFDLILCVDYLLSLAEFFKIPDELLKNKSEKIQETQSPHSRIAPRPTSQQPVVPATTESRMNLMLFIEEPDIILVESLEDINTNAIIFNMQAQLNYRGIGDRQIINGTIDGMKMYMCSFLPERREVTRHFIIHPCVISLQGSTPEEEGLHISLKLSDIIINVSPATIELLNKASRTLTANSPELAALPILQKDYSNIWEPKAFKDREHWFVKVDQGVDVLEMPELMESSVEYKTKSEKCVLEIPSITIVVEMGIGYYTTPLIMLDTSMEAVVSNWSSNLGVKGSLTLKMEYFNQALATWEPIIEPNEIQRRDNVPEYRAWELGFELGIENKRSEFDEDLEERTTKIKIHSEETLEMTLSKTCLDLLSVLGEVFSQAIDPSGLVKPEIIAPYVIENDTGFDIIVNFERGVFTLHEFHMPTSSNAPKLNKSLVFQAGQLKKPDQVKECIISAGGRAFLQTKDFSKIMSPEDEEYNMYVQVGGIDKKLILPVSKSDTRYFPLYRDTFQTAWGVVSEVRSEYGTTCINLHGVVNVENHFTTTVKIFRFNNQTKDKTLVGEVAAGAVFHVPLHAVYAENKELYFSLSGYNTSVQGIRWDDTPTDLKYTRQIQCDPIDTYEPLYLNVVREKTEIFHEHTNKFKLMSAFFTLHLRPPLYLRNALPIGIKVSVAGSSIRTVGNVNLDETDTEAIEANDELDASKSPIREDLLDYGEKDVYPGDCLHLPTVKLATKGKESRSYLVIRLMNYLEKDWSCTTKISQENETYTLWKFSTYNSDNRMYMDLCVRFEDHHGSLQLILFSPFWMINKTGLLLSYKSDSENQDVLSHPPDYSGPILYSIRDKFFGGKKRATIRVDNGEWSSKIPLDVAGSFGSVTCNANDMNYQIGVHNYLTYNSLTKQITFIPYYVANNKCKFAVELQEQTRPGDPWTKLEPDACTPIWPKNDSDNMITARVDGQCTVPFCYTEAQCTLLKLAKSIHGGINVDVQTTEGGVYITFTEYNSGDAPGLLVNHTSKEIIFREKGDPKEYVLKKRHKMLYAWNNPVGAKCLLFNNDKDESDLRRDAVGEYVLKNGQIIYWVSFLDGLQRVLLFTEIAAIASKTECSSALQTVTQSVEIRIHGIGISVLNNETGVDIMYLGITSSGVIWESKKESKKRYKLLKINECAQIEAQYQQYLRDREHSNRTYTFDKYPLDFGKMLLMKSTPREIRRAFYPGVWVLINSSPYQLQLHAKINKIQLDNQLNDCIFPVVLAPIAPPKSVATTIAFKPFVECSIVERVVPNSNVKQYKYATVLIQEFHFKVDLLFLNAIASLFTSEMTDEQAAKSFNADVVMIYRPLSELVATHSLQEHKNFYDNLHLGPLKIHVSFSMAGSDTTALPAILSTLVQGVGVTLTDVNDVVFRLAYFQRDFQFLTQRQLVSEISTHYTGQALKQLYVLVLGLDVLGNPYGLVVGLKKGVEDLFYEPFQGAIQGPGEFAEGLVLGVKSLFGHTVGGAAGAVSKITGAMGKGLAALTFDEDYQRKRRQALNVKPKNFGEGIARSGKGLVMGFVDGVAGVVTKPVMGAREEGVEGFFKGLGKGAVGLVTRPTAGMVDFASGSLEAVKQATSASEEAKRLRAPRFLHEDNVLRPYCRSEANGHKLLKEIERGKYASTDHFVYCEEVIVNHEYALLTNHRIIYMTKNDLFGCWTIQWTYLWPEIEYVINTERGIQITIKKEGKKVLGLFGGHEVNNKLLLMPSKERRDRLIEAIESQRSEI